MSWDGIYEGVVLSSADPQRLGRVRLQVPQVSGMQPTHWAFPAQAGASTPVVGQKVWVLYQGGDASYPVFMPPAPVVPKSVPAGDLELIQDWTKVTLYTGYDHNGNSNGDVRYRVVNLFGSTRLEWEGGISLTYPTAGQLPNNDFPLADPIPYRTTTTYRSMTAACSGGSSTSLSLKVDMRDDGHLRIIGITTSIQPPWVSLNGCYCYL